MPLLLLARHLQRLPWPSLHTYTAVSAALLARTVLTVCSSGFRPQSSPEETRIHPAHSSRSSRLGRDGAQYLSAEFEDVAADVLLHLLTDRVSVWVMVNTTCCVLLLTARLIQCVVFGPLRINEKQHLKDEFWTFISWKTIFVFSVLNVQMLEEVAMWWVWFAVLVFLHLLVQLCKDRFEYLSSSHVRVLLLVVLLLLCCGGLPTLCSWLARSQDHNTSLFMANECVLMTVRTTHVMFRYSIHLWDMNQESSWENKTSYIHYTDLLMELGLLGCDLLYNQHMLNIGDTWLAILVINMQLCFIFQEVQKRIRCHRNYLRLLRNMEALFSVASPDELAAHDDNCAICCDVMSSARKLPCGHLFHSSCLYSWLEQDAVTSCPTCRMSLNFGGRGVAINRLNYFIRFDGSRIASWLPNFSVEVTPTTNLEEQIQIALHW